MQQVNKINATEITKAQVEELLTDRYEFEVVAIDIKNKKALYIGAIYHYLISHNQAAMKYKVITVAGERVCSDLLEAIELYNKSTIDGFPAIDAPTPDMSFTQFANQGEYILGGSNDVWIGGVSGTANYSINSDPYRVTSPLAIEEERILYEGNCPSGIVTPITRTNGYVTVRGGVGPEDAPQI